MAIVDGDGRFTYAEWYAEIGRVADGLAAQGVRKGDRLGVVLQNRLAMATCIGPASSPASSWCR